MIRFHYLLICCLLCCCLPSGAGAATMAAVADDNIHINADRMNQNNSDGVYSAEGNVVVLWQGLTLTADRVRYATAAHMLHATGSVTLTKEGSVLKGETLALDMDTGRAEMDTTQLTMPESGMTVSAHKLVRVSETEFSATTTELTTCTMPDPSWKFGVEELKVNLLGYATGRHVIFYINNTPVLYLPWIAFPMVMEKRSGLLFPRVGYSNDKGAQLDIPVYWVISPSQDLQLDLDIMTRRGVGTGIDYRYIRNRTSEGHIGAYSIYDQVENRWRWQLSQEHKEIFAPDANLRMSVTATGDRSFFKDFGEKAGDYNRQSGDITVNALKTGDTYAVNAYLRRTEDLYATDNRATVQTLPSLGAAAVRHSILSVPLYVDLDSTVDNLYRDAAPSGQRLYLFPRVTLLPFRNKYVQTTLYAGAHLRGYATDRRDSSVTHASDGDLLPEAGARLTTSLTRIYDMPALTVKKIRHEIIPELRYGFVPDRDQGRLPSYDYTDRIIGRNLVSLSVTSLMNGKFVSGETTEYRDISRIKLSADYAIEGGRRDLLTLVDSQRPWSDLILESDTWLTRQMKVTFDARYSPYEHHLSTAVAGIEADDRQGNSIGAGYQMARNEVEYLEGRFSTKLVKPLSLSYTARYSFDNSTFLESVYAAEYRHQCWSVNLAVHQRPGNQSYTVNFNLAGLGSK